MRERPPETMGLAIVIGVVLGILVGSSVATDILMHKLEVQQQVLLQHIDRTNK